MFRSSYTNWFSDWSDRWWFVTMKINHSLVSPMYISGSGQLIIYVFPLWFTLNSHLVNNNTRILFCLEKFKSDPFISQSACLFNASSASHRSLFASVSALTWYNQPTFYSLSDVRLFFLFHVAAFVKSLVFLLPVPLWPRWARACRWFDVDSNGMFGICTVFTCSSAL